MIHDLIHFFGGAICHQLEERSLYAEGSSLSICARCTGIYIGIISTLFYLLLWKKKRPITIPSKKTSFLLLLLFLPLIADGVGSYLHLFESNNLRRLITGISFGLVLPYFLFPLMSTTSLEPTAEPIIDKKKDFFIPLLLSIFLGSLFYLGKPSHLVLDSLLIVSLILWFTIVASFLFSICQNIRIKWTLAFVTGTSILLLLAQLHEWVLAAVLK